MSPILGFRRRHDFYMVQLDLLAFTRRRRFFLFFIFLFIYLFIYFFFAKANTWLTLSSPWKMSLDQSMTFHRVLPELWQTVRLSTPMDADSYTYGDIFK